MINLKTHKELIKLSKYNHPLYSGTDELLSIDKNYGVVELNPDGAWNDFSGFNSEFKNVILIVSNTNGEKDSKNNCSYSVRVGYTCPAGKQCT